MSIELSGGVVRSDGVTLLDRVDFSAGQGEVVAVIGPNGAGKTTLMRVLANEIPASSGRLLIDGETPPQIGREELARRVAVLPQRSVLDFPFRVHEVIGMGRIPHRTSSFENRKIVQEVIDSLALAPIIDRVYTTLSGGERQRVQIARVICQLWDCREGGYFLFDEPTAPLDLAHQVAFLETARSLAADGAGVLLVIHDINLATRFADRIAILSQGRIVSDGKPVDVVTREAIESVYGIRVDVIDQASGAPTVRVLGSRTR
ncbi:MAG: heme ABC transporter ATP-binding protein [Pseudomonadales bacterium]|nr:heme ABC transporter ATP-binding protein [Pseudomonadales bacterium]